MNALRAMYGLRRVCLAVTSILLSASTIHLLNLPSEPANLHLSQGLHDLQAMTTNHQFAARCVEIILGLAKKWNITLPEGSATASPFRPGGQRQWPSPTSFTFWAASILRKESSGGTTSSDSASSHHESPLSPPPPQSQRHPPFGSFFSDPTVPLDTSQSQTAFWTPFPGQTMPAPPQHIVPSMTMDFSTMESEETQSTQWPTFGGGVAGLTVHMQDITQQRPGVQGMGESLSFEGWRWQ